MHFLSRLGPYSNVIVSSPPLKLGGVLVFKIWTKRGVMKKLLRNRGLVERGVLLEREGFFSLSGKYSHLL